MGLPWMAVTSPGPVDPPRGPTWMYCPEAGAGVPGLIGEAMMASPFCSHRSGKGRHMDRRKSSAVRPVELLPVDTGT